VVSGKPRGPIRAVIFGAIRRIYADLKQRGHDVWFDKRDITFGDDWRRSITSGITECDRFFSFLSKHSTRDPGTCRDEIAIGIGVKGGNIHTILVESEQKVQPPVNIGRSEVKRPEPHQNSTDCWHSCENHCTIAIC
jgi:hypothetical protein